MATCILNNFNYDEVMVVQVTPCYIALKLHLFSDILVNSYNFTHTFVSKVKSNLNEVFKVFSSQ